MVKITGIGSYIPKRCVTNEQISSQVDTSDEWIKQRTGIAQRYFASPTESVEYMATMAGKQAIADAGINVDDIDLILVATVTAEQFFPAVACLVQKNLGITNHCLSFDVNAACAGYIVALQTAANYIRANMANNILVVGVDRFSSLLTREDRSTYVLFGDGAGAVVLSKAEQEQLFASKLFAAGKYANLLYSSRAQGNITMDGKELFKHAVNKMAQATQTLLDEQGLTPADINFCIPHQANARIIHNALKMLNISNDKIIMTVDEHANTSAASIPLALHHGIKKGKVKRGNLILHPAIGAGLIWGAVVLKL